MGERAEMWEFTTGGEKECTISKMGEVGGKLSEKA